jgi:uncharacterized protein
MHLQMLPKNVKRIEPDDVFSFQCHPGISCFTHCCRQLELALTPYDVLRLKKATGLSSSAFLENYVIIEREKEDVFPRLYLTMVDDGNASCVFVAQNGCSLYQDRPGACRAYPMGRAAVLRNENSLEEFYVLLEESHCRGFNQNLSQTPRQYGQDQGLVSYNRFNDKVGSILQHEKIRQGMILTEEQVDTFVLSLYDIDSFREMILNGSLPHAPLGISSEQELADDETLLLFAIDWLKNELFGEC